MDTKNLHVQICYKFIGGLCRNKVNIKIKSKTVTPIRAHIRDVDIRTCCRSVRGDRCNHSNLFNFRRLDSFDKSLYIRIFVKWKKLSRCNDAGCNTTKLCQSAQIPSDQKYRRNLDDCSETYQS